MVSASARQRLRALVLVALIAAAGGWAYAPLFASGPVGRDLALARALARVERGEGVGAAERAGWVESPPLRPLATASLRAVERLAPRADATDPRSIRAATLAGIALAALACAGFTRRVLVPWLGDSSARAAAQACAAFALLHPASIAAAARPDAHGDALAMALVFAAAWAFLYGRQERRSAALAAAATLGAAASFASSLAWVLPVVAAVAELGAVRRPRAFTARLARASVVLAAAVACVAIEAFAARAAGASGRAEFASALPFADPAGAGADLVRVFEKLGVVLMPVPAASGAAYLVAAAVPLIALVPSLRAARAAPRAWSWLAAAWIGALALGLAPRAFASVEPGDATHLERLLPAAFALAAGLGSTSTALPGTRRFVVPAVGALLFAWLARGTAESWPPAARELARLQADLAAATRGEPPPRRVLVADPLRRAGALELLDFELGLLLDPPLAARVEAREIALDAIAPLARTALFDAWRRDGLVCVLPGGALDARDPVVPLDPRAPRTIVLVEPPGADVSRRVWREKGTSPQGLEFDPIALACVRASAMPDVTTSEAPRMSWRSSRPAAENGSLAGVWILEREGAVALFDPSRSLAWLLGGRVKRVLFDSPLTSIASAELCDRPPFATEIGAPSIEGSTFAFDVPGESVPRVVRGEVRFVLVVVDLATLAAREIDGRRRADGRVEFVGVPGALGPRAYWLEARVGDTCVARAAGREGA